MIATHPLPKGQFIETAAKKVAIVLHHTAGGHHPKWTIDAWARDPQRIATAYVIGGISTTDNSSAYDGMICEAFNPKWYAFHLGVKGSPFLDQITIGIEICNYGWLRFANGVFYNYVNKPVPSSQVYDLGAEWRGYRYWHAYTDTQLNATRELLLSLSATFGINVRKKWTSQSFDISKDALRGQPGLWTHGNYRRDKTDCSPQKPLIDMLNSL